VLLGAYANLKRAIAQTHGMERLAVIGALSVAASLSYSLVVARPASAHNTDMGFKWFNNGYDYENIELSGVGSSWSVTSGVWDWYWNSDLQVNYAGGHEEIEYQEGNFGSAVAQGRADVYSNSSRCIANGVVTFLCSKVYPDQATSAVLLLNTYYSDSTSVAKRPIVSRHELGHVFGLKHYSESSSQCEGSLMDNGGCNPHQATVTAHDAEIIYILYP
jgi:hypothetical protein